MKDKTITEIENMRNGLTEILVYALNKYEEQSGMIVERIEINSETGEVEIYDRLTRHHSKENIN